VPPEPTGAHVADDGVWLPLRSDGPHPDIAPGDRIFDPFIGSWDLEVSWYEDGVLTPTLPGEWHFAWVLEDRAIQDVWLVPRRELRTAGQDLCENGTSLRFPDASIGGWRSTWLGPMQRSVRTFAARRSGPQVVRGSVRDRGRVAAALGR
jgi:hypothetical protein